MPGTKKALSELAQTFTIWVLTARPNTGSIRRWLQEQGLMDYIAEVTNVKPSAAAYIDNRSYFFKNWPQTVKDMEKGEQTSYSSNVPGGTS